MSRAGLDKTRVVQAAARLANTQGVEALTLHRLAAALDVRTPSLYNHIDGLPGLYHEMALLSTRLLGERLGRAAVGKSGAPAVHALAAAYRQFIKDEPGLYQAGLRYQPYRKSGDADLSAAEAAVVDIVLAVVAHYGLAGSDALHAVRGLRSLVHGFATLEIAGGFGLPLDLDESFTRLVEMFVVGLARV